MLSTSKGEFILENKSQRKSIIFWTRWSFCNYHKFYERFIKFTQENCFFSLFLEQSQQDTENHPTISDNQKLSNRGGKPLRFEGGKIYYLFSFLLLFFILLNFVLKKIAIKIGSYWIQILTLSLHVCQIIKFTIKTK